MTDYPYRSKVLDGLGVRSWINARNWSTTIGGCWIDDRVLSAMDEVAKTFVDMHELIAAADNRIARLCNVDAAHVTTGTAGAMELAAAACMAGNDYGAWMRLPHTEGLKNEVVIPRGHYISYTPQWTAAGAKLVEFGQAGTLKSFHRELEAALTDQTCCIAYTVSYNTVPRGMIPFEEIVEAGRKHGIPVVVDMASDIPPVSNLSKFCDMGADIVCISGGKAIKAPNNTGIMLGKTRGVELIDAVRSHSFPHPGWGRGHKISKEQIVGLVTALEIFMEEGDALYEQQMQTAVYLKDALSSIPHIDVTIIPNNAAFHEHPVMSHVPRVLIQWDEEPLGMTAGDLDRAVAKDNPPIFLRDTHYADYYTNKQWRLIDTFFLREGEPEIIAHRLKKIFMDAGR
jgi:D-glucosaminate-6-phosphate ammonia-lyase